MKDVWSFILLINLHFFCLRDADLKPLLHTVTAFPVSAGERGVCPKICRCIYSLHLTGGSLIQLRVWQPMVATDGVHSTEGWGRGSGLGLGLN